MSELAMTEVSMEKCILDIPYEILFKIFSQLPKSRLIEVSRLCSKFRNVAGDTRFWKDAYIKYKPAHYPFEELYLEPWPVKVIDLYGSQIDPPVSSQTDQVVKVTKLKLSPTKANEATMAAMLAKYQCTELYLDSITVLQNSIAPEAFSKQTAIEVFSLEKLKRPDPYDHGCNTGIGKWFAQVLKNCKNLKTLDLNSIYLTDSETIDFVRNLPRSLENLSVAGAWLEDYFFELLAETSPNLRQLSLSPKSIKLPSLLKFKFLGALHVFPRSRQNISYLSIYLMQFPSLKTVCIVNSLVEGIERFRATLEPHGIIVRLIQDSGFSYPVGGNVWHVRKGYKRSFRHNF